MPLKEAIVEVLKAGGGVTFPFKEKPEEWWGASKVAYSSLFDTYVVQMPNARQTTHASPEEAADAFLKAQARSLKYEPKVSER